MGTPGLAAALTAGCWPPDIDRSWRTRASHLFQSSFSLVDSRRSISSSSWSSWPSVAEDDRFPQEVSEDREDRVARDLRISCALRSSSS